MTTVCLRTGIGARKLFKCQVNNVTKSTKVIFSLIRNNSSTIAKLNTKMNVFYQIWITFS